MLTQDIAKIEGAVIALCPDVEAIQCNRSPACLNERQHWAELICCLLSSQVPYESAVTATKIIKERKLLPCDNIECYKQYEENLSDLLKQPIFDGRRYRFPALRAKQISNTGEEFLQPDVLAVAERYLGDGIFERAKTIGEIRKKLSGLKRYQPIHVLGAGNPLSVAILAAVGADLFDGLEWCRTSVDHQTARLHHAHQYDFYSWQSEWVTVDWDYVDKMLAHNLEFYRDWNTDLSQAIADGRLWEWLQEEEYLSISIVDDARNQIGV